MARLITVLYLLNCLHMTVARPGHAILMCPECLVYKRAVEVRACA